MGDFTKRVKEVLNKDKVLASAPDSIVPNEYGGIYDKPKPRKQGFIEARMNKDNFWNLMFWLGMSLGLWITVQFDKEYSTAAFICAWSTILGVPSLIKWNSRVTFDKEKGFFSKDGRSLENSYPKKFGIIFVLAVAITVLLGFIMDKTVPHLNNSIVNILIPSTFFLIITLYFILINCPISLLFNKNAWTLSRTHQLTTRNHEPLTSPNNMYSNPVNSWYSGNIYHRNHHK